MFHQTQSVPSFSGLWANEGELLKNCKHTRGRWKFHAQGDANQYALLTNDNRWVISFQQNGEIWTSEQIANARLIAAAPDLLLGLIALEEAARQAMAGEMALDSLAVERYKSREIIAEATGNLNLNSYSEVSNDGSRKSEVTPITAASTVGRRSQTEERMLKVLCGLDDFSLLDIEGTECCEELEDLKLMAKQLKKDLLATTPAG